MAVTTRGPTRAPARRRTRRPAPRRSQRPSPSLPLLGPLLLAPLALALTLLVGFQLVYAGRIYPGVAALGLDLGGETPARAQASLAQRSSALSQRSITLQLGDQRWTTSAADLGVVFDPAALADAAYQVGRQGSPPGRILEQLGALLAGSDVAADPASPDAAVVSTYVRSLATEIDRPVEEAHLAVNPDFSLDSQPGHSGRTLDQRALEPKLRALLLQGGSIDLEGLVREVQPRTTEAQVTDARQVAERILASPLDLRFGKQHWTIERETLARVLRFESPDGKAWSVQLDEAPLQQRLVAIADELNQDPQDARLSWNGGDLQVLRESKQGQHLDVVGALTAAKQALESDNHTVDLPVQVAKPAVDMNDLGSLGVVELIEKSSTAFAGSIPEKQHNIKLAASLINGTVVPAGATFSFNHEVGPTTLDAGFKWGYGLESSSNGVKTVPSVAGGICQVATTLFQPVFWSGYRIEERNWHLYWIPAYTSRDLAGLDATVDEASGLDFKFVNDTSTALLIQSSTTDTTVTFALYGTKPDWKVKVDEPVVTNARKADPTPKYEAQPEMPWGWRLHVSAARDGFDVTIVRTVTQGADSRTLKLSSVYQPSQDVTLVGTQDMPDGASLGPDATPIPKPEATPAPAATGAAAASTPPAQATAAAAPAQPTAAAAAAQPAGEANGNPVVRAASPQPQPTTPAAAATPKKTQKGKAKATPTSGH